MFVNASKVLLKYFTHKTEQKTSKSQRIIHFPLNILKTSNG